MWFILLYGSITYISCSTYDSEAQCYSHGCGWNPDGNECVDCNSRQYDTCDTYDNCEGYAGEMCASEGYNNIPINTCIHTVATSLDDNFYYGYHCHTNVLYTIPKKTCECESNNITTLTNLDNIIQIYDTFYYMTDVNSEDLSFTFKIGLATITFNTTNYGEYWKCPLDKYDVKVKIFSSEFISWKDVSCAAKSKELLDIQSVNLTGVPKNLYDEWTGDNSDIAFECGMKDCDDWPNCYEYENDCFSCNFPRSICDDIEGCIWSGTECTSKNTNSSSCDIIMEMVWPPPSKGFNAKYCGGALGSVTTSCTPTSCTENSSSTNFSILSGYITEFEYEGMYYQVNNVSIIDKVISFNIDYDNIGTSLRSCTCEDLNCETLEVTTVRNNERTVHNVESLVFQEWSSDCCKKKSSKTYEILFGIFLGLFIVLIIIFGINKF